MAANKFKPKASSNIIEGATPVEETGVTMTPDESVGATPTEETPVAESTETTSVGKTEEDSVKEEVSETAPTVTFEDKKSTPIEKNVKICLKTKHSCNIGGVAYHFEKGKQYNVPASVKSILMQADLLMPL